MLKNIFFAFIALLAGLALPYAFAPYSIYWLAIISPAVLLALWLNASVSQATWRGLLFGLGFFGNGVGWVYISIHHYGNAPASLAWVISGLLVLFLSLFQAVQGYVLTRMFPVTTFRKLLFAFPATWVLLEWVRTWFLTGFPWLFVGYSQGQTPLAGWAPIGGVYLLSFIALFTAGAIVSLWVFRKTFCRILVVMVAVVLLWVGGWYLSEVDWTLPTGPGVKVSLVQGNIPQEEKWNHKYLRSILNQYLELNSQAWGSKIIVWPEAAIPVFPRDVKEYLNDLNQAAKDNQATIFAGLPLFDQFTANYYNAIMLFGENDGTYLKRHLVPFGEYVPLKPLLGWLSHFVIIPMSGFTAGPSVQPSLSVANILIAPFICYEIAYPGLVASYLPKAQMLITVSDDSWFGKSVAADQHLEIAQMRALETGRFLLLSSNTGITAIINPKGKVIQRAHPFTPSVITATVQSISGATPWISYGQHLWLLMTIICLWIATLRDRG